MSDRQPKVSIPENHQEFCRDIARLCRKHKMRNFSGSYRPDFYDPWDGEIKMVWEQGRYGEESDKLFISSEVRAYTWLGKDQP